VFLVVQRGKALDDVIRREVAYLKDVLVAEKQGVD
jgi:hypothetical protein